LLAFFLPTLLLAQEPIDQAANAKIRSEAADHSQGMLTLHILADRYGPRLVGSPNHKAAARWAAKQLADWGLQNARLEPWDFGHPGWVNEHAAGCLLSPTQDHLDFRVAAWTPSTKGTVKAPAVQVLPPQGTRDEMTAWLKTNQAKVCGKIVLVGKAATISPGPVPRPAGAVPGGNRPNAGGPETGGARQGRPPPDPNRLTAAQADELVNAWLVANAALVRVHDGGGANGLIREVHNRTYDAAKAVPGVILRNEDYGRIERLLQDGEDVKMEFNIVNRWYPEGRTSYNVLAEIPGTDKPGEVVMLGAHLDSWHLATGATDNGAGVAMMMEAVRIIQAAGLKPRRTIRIGLWSGEEEGLLGSQAYVKAHLGTFENPKPEFHQVICYFNVDSGAGSVRSVMVFGPQEAQAVMQEAIAPFADLGAGGSSAFLSRALGSTDSSSFSHAGVSTIDLMQNSTDYGTTHHTNLDTYGHVAPDQLIKGSTVITAAVWHVANRDPTLPLFTKEQMPPPAAAK
jgi:hypothetical protein